VAEHALAYGEIDAGVAGRRSEIVSLAHVNGNARVVVAAGGAWGGAVVELKGVVFAGRPGERLVSFPDPATFSADSDEPGVDIADEAAVCFEVTTAAAGVTVYWMIYAVDA